MNTLKLQCICGQTYQAEPEHIGSSILCKRCGNLVPVEQSSTLQKLLVRQKQGKGNQFNAFNPGRVRRRVGLVPILSCAIVVGVYGCIVTSQSQSADLTKPNQLTASPNSVSHDHVAVPRPRNGYNLLPVQSPSSLSNLTVINGSTDDAIVKLVPVLEDKSVGKAELCVYVRANNQVVLSNFGSKSYILMFRTGSEWNGSNGFNEDQTDSKFGEQLDFRDVSTHFDPQAGGSLSYHSYTVTLNPVVDGNVQTQHCDPDEFNGAQ